MRVILLLDGKPQKDAANIKNSWKISPLNV